MERKLATIRIIEEIAPIEGADRIQAYRVDGWWVVGQKGDYEVGSKVLYLEIDSWVPNKIAPFLTKPGKEPRVFENIAGERLRTIKLKGQVSQGLLLPLSILHDVADYAIQEADGTGHTDFYKEEAFMCTDLVGADATELLGIVKWEKELSANLQGVARGNFPSFLRKTDQERVQNVKIENILSDENNYYEVTEKLDGSSCTIYRNGYRVGVCSRNLDLEFNVDNSFCAVEQKYEIAAKLMKLKRNLAVQGELIGPGIQGGSYGISEIDFYVFDVYDIDNQRYLSPSERWEIVETLGLKHVPIIDLSCHLEYDSTKQSILRGADGSSKLATVAREGLVYKSHRNTEFSFKVISDEWLMQNDG